jgi:aspartyl protease family protein
MSRLPATVNGADMSDSLLGMEFLNRLHGWGVKNGVLTLVP